MNLQQSFTFFFSNKIKPLQLIFRITESLDVTQWHEVLMLIESASCQGSIQKTFSLNIIKGKLNLSLLNEHVHLT